MKKLLTFALCLAAIGTMGAQKATVKAAKGMSGDPSKIEEARKLINEAMQNPETANDAETYYVAGKIEFDTFDKELTSKLIGQTVDPLKMGQELINGYNQFLKAIPLDQQPNEKGKVKPRFTKDITNKIKGYQNDFNQAGVDFYNARKYYPEAYESFMIFADMPDMEIMKNEKFNLPDTIRGEVYYYAGNSAFFGNEFAKASEAFRKARKFGFTKPEAYSQELACWQTVVQRDSTMTETAKQKINEIAEEGNAKFGMSQPVFFFNIINFLVLDEKFDEALAKTNPMIEANPNDPALYGLRGFIYDRQGKDEESVADYKKSASFENANFEQLREAAAKIYRVGADKYNNINGNGEAEKAARLDVKNNYFQVAKELTDRAKALGTGNDSRLDYLIENIDYALTTFFN